MSSSSSSSKAAKSVASLFLKQCYLNNGIVATTARSMSSFSTQAACLSHERSAAATHSFVPSSLITLKYRNEYLLANTRQQRRCLSSSSSKSTSSQSFSSSAAVISDYDYDDEYDTAMSSFFANKQNNHHHHHHHHDDEDHNTQHAKHKHCKTCTCEEDLPPPLPPPKYSFHKRVLPPNLTSLSSPTGQTLFLQSLQTSHANSYFPLSEQFINQSDPAYCGITTLCMICNAMCIDPNVRWKGGWRWFGSEELLLEKCCLEKERIKRIGVNMEEFCMVGRCHGVSIELKRPSTTCNEENGNEHEQMYDLDEFRKDVIYMVQNPPHVNTTQGGFLVVSFARSSLSQTGEGHFSPIAAYHPPTDSVLVLDVARFKYSPYWVSLSELYDAMKPLDESTHKSRGWFLMHPPPIDDMKKANRYEGPVNVTEGKRPAECVPEMGQGDVCPVGEIKVEYCSVNSSNSSSRRRRREENGEDGGYNDLLGRRRK